MVVTEADGPAEAVTTIAAILVASVRENLSVLNPKILFAPLEEISTAGADVSAVGQDRQTGTGFIVHQVQEGDVVTVMRRRGTANATGTGKGSVVDV